MDTAYDKPDLSSRSEASAPWSVGRLNSSHDQAELCEYLGVVVCQSTGAKGI